MSTQLGNLAEIRAGLTFRGRLSTYPEGRTFVIQARTIDQVKVINTHGLPGIQLPTLAEGHLVQQNDLIISPKAESNEIQRVERVKGEVVISSPLLLVRVNSKRALPEFIHWYLQHPQAVRQMKQFTEGSVIRKLGKKTLEQISIPLPEMKIQHVIADLLTLASKEQSLLSKLQAKRKQLIDATLMQITTQ